MTLISDAQVQILLADYLSLDAANKLNMIGGGLSYIGGQGGGQPSSPFAVSVTVTVPAARYVGTTYALNVELHDVTVGRLLMVPTESGQMTPLRAQQAVTVPPTQVAPGMAVPADALQGHQMVMQFAGGLPLDPGHSYEWRVEIDGQKRRDWFFRFHVLAPAAGPVFGGPANPSAIPGFGEYTVDPTAQPGEQPGGGAPQ